MVGNIYICTFMLLMILYLHCTSDAQLGYVCTRDRCTELITVFYTLRIMELQLGCIDCYCYLPALSRCM